MYDYSVPFINGINNSKRMSDTYFDCKTVKIRKERVCFGCSRKFEPKQEMNIQTGIFNGYFYKTYHCLTCYEIQNLVSENYTDGYMDNWVQDEIRESKPYSFIGQLESPEIFLNQLKQ